MQEVTRYNFLYSMTPIVVFSLAEIMYMEQVISFAASLVVSIIVYLVFGKMPGNSGALVLGVGVATCAVGTAFMEGFVDEWIVLAAMGAYISTITWDFGRFSER